MILIKQTKINKNCHKKWGKLHELARQLATGKFGPMAKHLQFSYYFFFKPMESMVLSTNSAFSFKNLAKSSGPW